MLSKVTSIGVPRFPAKFDPFRNSHFESSNGPSNQESPKSAKDWNSKLWKGLNAWAELDPLHGSRVNALKVAFYQSQVRIEAYFIETGMKPEKAKSLATSTLRHLVGNSLERFI